MITPRNLQPQRSAEDDREYRQNYTSAELINGLYALDSGWTGKGVRVGILDDGIANISELDGQVDRNLSRDFGHDLVNGVRQDRSGGSNTGDSSSTHGTPVAAIIAARNDGVGVQGLAPDATLVALRVDGMIDGERTYGLGLGTAIRYAADKGIPILNMSLGQLDPDVASPSLQSAATYYHGRAKGLIVNSAGNDALEKPSDWLNVTDANRESWLFVVALESSTKAYRLASYSNQCGPALERCVAAVGTNATVSANGAEISFSGTSSAAPQVSALVAMILSKWPQLTGVDAGNVIIKTARDIGQPGVDAVYGHGLIDAKAALSPISPTLSNGLQTSSIDNAVMVLGAAFGGFGTNSIESAFSDITVIDAYGRDFSADVAGLVVRQSGSNTQSLNRRMQAQANARTAGFATRGASASVGVTAFETGIREADGSALLRNELTTARLTAKLGDGFSVAAGYNGSDNVIDDRMGLAPTSDAILSYAPLAQTSFGMRKRFSRANIAVSAYFGSYGGASVKGLTAQLASGPTSIKLGLIDEAGTVLGTPVGAGTMRFGDGARTVFLESASGIDIGAWRLDGYGSLGATELKVENDTLLTKAGTIASGRFGLAVSRPIFDGRASVGVAQSLVALSGVVTFTLGDRYDVDARNLIFAHRTVSVHGRIAPQLNIGYDKVGNRSVLGFAAASNMRGGDLRAIGHYRFKY